MAAPRVMYLLHRSRLFLMTANSSLADFSTRVPAQMLLISSETPARVSISLMLDFPRTGQAKVGQSHVIHGVGRGC